MSSSVIVLGAGGHAKVCLEILESCGYTVAFCIGAVDSEDSCLHVPVLKGNDEALLNSLFSKGYKKVFVAIGINALRKKLAQIALQCGFEIVSAVSPNAIVSPSATIGSGVAVMAGAVINAKANIGNYCIVNTGVTIDHDCIIKSNCHLAPQSALAGCVRIGENSFLGIGTVVIPDVVIGADVIIGAGSVVIHDIPDSVMAAGVPAVVKKSFK